MAHCLEPLSYKLFSSSLWYSVVHSKMDVLKMCSATISTTLEKCDNRKTFSISFLLWISTLSYWLQTLALYLPNVNKNPAEIHSVSKVRPTLFWLTSALVLPAGFEPSSWCKNQSNYGSFNGCLVDFSSSSMKTFDQYWTRTSNICIITYNYKFHFISYLFKW